MYGVWKGREGGRGQGQGGVRWGGGVVNTLQIES